jgi:hypothetical protein
MLKKTDLKAHASGKQRYAKKQVSKTGDAFL